jgi:hypothetical protein
MSLSQRDLYLIIGATAGIVLYYKVVKPIVDQYI